jgi:hypothetical protein
VVDYLSENEMRHEILFGWVGEQIVKLLGWGRAGAHSC